MSGGLKPEQPSSAQEKNKKKKKHLVRHLKRERASHPVLCLFPLLRLMSVHSGHGHGTEALYAQRISGGSEEEGFFLTGGWRSTERRRRGRRGGGGKWCWAVEVEEAMFLKKE